MRLPAYASPVLAGPARAQDSANEESHPDISFFDKNVRQQGNSLLLNLKNRFNNKTAALFILQKQPQ